MNDVFRTDQSAPASRWTRRQLLAGVGVALSVTAVGRLGSGSVGAISGQLNEAGQALEPAERIAPPTTTIPPPEPGKILFPIIVGPGDRCYLNDNFGASRGGGRYHEGNDIMADHGLPVRAVVAGQLTKRYVASGLTSGAGNGWTLYDATTKITYKFFHLDRHEDGLEVGDFVTMGQVIGYVGNTGTSGALSDTNYHLHFEYRPNDVAVRSYDLLQRVPNVRFL